MDNLLNNASYYSIFTHIDTTGISYSLEKVVYSRFIMYNKPIQINSYCLTPIPLGLLSMLL